MSWLLGGVILTLVDRLPMVMARRTVVLGLVVGGTMTALERVAGLRP